MQRQSTTTRPRRLIARVAMLAGLTLAGLSLGGCIVYAPPHYHRGYYY